MDHSLDKKVKRNDNKLCQKGKLNYKNVFRSHLKVTTDSARAQWVTSLYLHPQYNPDVVNWRAVWEMASGLKVCPKLNIQIQPFGK